MSNHPVQATIYYRERGEHDHIRSLKQSSERCEYMVFSSIEFLLFFLPLFLILYGLTPDKYKNVTLLSGSLVFYALGEPWFVFLLMLSVFINYFFGLHLGRKVKKKEKDNLQEIFDLDIEYNQRKIYKRRRRLFAAAVALNLGLLGFFKYCAPGDTIPLGISFYTFQILSYLIDLFRGEERRETSFINLATYIVMFPQLIAGPIVNYGEVREALKHREFTAAGLQEGLKVFTMGLVSKVLLADRIGLLWQEAQVAGFESISTPLAWLAAAAYSLKLYFDFYGYSLMAAGLGTMLGFELPCNFKNPYMAVSVRDFYRCWHMTLGRWFRRYVYIPLGGNRRGELRTIFNLAAVWGLTALWHGSTLNFLVWGLMLAALIITERQLARIRLPRALRLPAKALSHIYLLALIPVTWMCFAITDTGQLRLFLGRMFGTAPGMNVNLNDWRSALENYGILFAAGFFACTPAMEKIFKRFKNHVLGMAMLAVLFWLCVWRLQVEGQNPFMYSNF